jgi:hypothetical protein
MPFPSVEKNDPPKSKAASQDMSRGQQQVFKDTQKSKLIIPKKNFDTSANSVFRQIDQRDKQQAIQNYLRKKEQRSLPASPDSTWNIYTGNPGFYSADGDTLYFGNTEFMPDSLFEEQIRMASSKSAKPYGMEGKVLNIPREDWLLGILLIGWILFASVKVGFNKYLNLLMGSLVKVSVATRLYTERGYKKLYGAIRLNFLFYLIVPLAVYQILDFYHVKIPGLKGPLFFLILFIAINTFILAKSLVYRSVGTVIMLEEEINESIFNIFLFYKGLALFLLPIVTIHAVEHRVNFVTIWIMIFLIALFYFVSILRSIYIGNRKGISIFYLILYLCLLEILPLFLIYKILTMG